MSCSMLYLLNEIALGTGNKQLFLRLRDTKWTKKCGSQIFDWACVGKHGCIVSDMAWYTHVVWGGEISKWWMVGHYPIFLPCQCVWRNGRFYSSIVQHDNIFFNFPLQHIIVMRWDVPIESTDCWDGNKHQKSTEIGVFGWSTAWVSWFMNSVIRFIL